MFSPPPNTVLPSTCAGAAGSARAALTTVAWVVSVLTLSACDTAPGAGPVGAQRTRTVGGRASVDAETVEPDARPVATPDAATDMARAADAARVPDDAAERRDAAPVAADALRPADDTMVAPDAPSAREDSRVATDALVVADATDTNDGPPVVHPGDGPIIVPPGDGPAVVHPGDAAVFPPDAAPGCAVDPGAPWTRRVPRIGGTVVFRGVGDIISRFRRPPAQVKSRVCGHATRAGRAANPR
jgi:hypothetical protein